MLANPPLATMVEHDRNLKLDLRGLPPVYVLAAHLSINEQHEAEDALSSSGASLTYDIKEANIVLGNVSKSKRAKSELLWKGVRVEDIENISKTSSPSTPEDKAPAKKWRKIGGKANEAQQRNAEVVIDNSSTASETEDGADADDTSSSRSLPARMPVSLSVSSPAARDTPPPPILLASSPNLVKVVKLGWLNDSLIAEKTLALEPYTIYTGRLVTPEEPATNRPAVVESTGVRVTMGNNNAETKIGALHGIMNRAKADPMPSVNRYIKRDRTKDAANRDFAGKRFSSFTQAPSQQANRHITRPTHLLHQTTSEHEEAASSSLPPMPEWVRENKIYACERATPLTSPNQAFICLLKKIKLARLLTLDEIGVRAYSSSIASLAAYPHFIQSTREILALPSCDQKIAHLFHEYQTTGKLDAVTEIEADPVIKVLGEFYEIWGVGAKTAREFYYDKGWRDLDDVIEYGWKSLSRVQQIGLKYYDEFMLKIPRAEVESIAATITQHAGRVTDEGVESIIVGGYRRGKSER